MAGLAEDHTVVGVSLYDTASAAEVLCLSLRLQVTGVRGG
jgi:hypothetical protein